MFIEIEGYLNYLVKHKITPNQFLFLYLRNNLDTETMSRYIDAVRAWKREEIQDLINRGFLDDVNSPGEEYAEAYFVTPKFSNDIFEELDQPGEELLAAYPAFFYIEGRRLPAKTCDIDHIAKVYGQKIRKNRKKHEKIIKLIEELKSQNRISMGIEKFVLSCQWDCIWSAEKDGLRDTRTSQTSQEL